MSNIRNTCSPASSHAVRSGVEAAQDLSTCENIIVLSHYTTEYLRRRLNDCTEQQDHDSDNFDGNDSFQDNDNDNSHLNGNDNFDDNDNFVDNDNVNAHLKDNDNFNDNDSFDGNDVDDNDNLDGNESENSVMDFMDNYNGEEAGVNARLPPAK
jgi:hypothetical protein